MLMKFIVRAMNILFKMSLLLGSKVPRNIEYLLVFKEYSCSFAYTSSNMYYAKNLSVLETPNWDSVSSLNVPYYANVMEH